MLVAVTGAAGHIGGLLIRRLSDAGHTVRALVHTDTRAVEGVPVERVEGDVRDVDSLRRLVDGTEVVFHCAARISIENVPHAKIQEINVLGPRNVVTACLDAKVRRLIHFSSIHAIESLPKDQPVDERRPRTVEHHIPYDRSKALGEGEIRAGIARGLDAVIVNPTGVVGPYDFRLSRMGRVLTQIYHGTLPALVDGGFNWVDVRDVVKSAMAAVEKGRTGENYLLGGNWVHFNDVGRTIYEVTGKRPPRITAPLWLARVGVPFVGAWAKLTGTEPLYTGPSLHTVENHLVVSSDKARAELGHTSYTFKETVTDTFAWFREAGMLKD